LAASLQAPAIHSTCPVVTQFEISAASAAFAFQRTTLWNPCSCRPKFVLVSHGGLSGISVSCGGGGNGSQSRNTCRSSSLTIYERRCRRIYCCVRVVGSGRQPQWRPLHRRYRADDPIYGPHRSVFEFRAASVGGLFHCWPLSVRPDDQRCVGQITVGVGPVSGAKIFPFCSHAIQFIHASSYPATGAVRDRHETRGGMRWTRKPRLTRLA
jgi:hypothetical protein